MHMPPPAATPRRIIDVPNRMFSNIIDIGTAST
jgi:hypothetical protein